MADTGRTPKKARARKAPVAKSRAVKTAAREAAKVKKAPARVKKAAAKKPAARRRRTAAKVEKTWQERFLAALEEHITVSEACKVSEVSRSNAYEERERSQIFADAWDHVVERTTEELEREAYRRAYQGWIEREEFEIHDGERLATLQVRKYSDTLLIFLLKARRPTTYRERVSHEHSGAGGGPIEHRARLDLSVLSEEQLTALEAIQPDAGSANPD